VSRAAALLALAGLAAATALMAHHGFGAVLAAFAAAGVGVLWSSLFHVVAMALNARAWQAVVPRGRGRSLPFFTWMVWVRESVNGLLPVARVGGEVATARLLVRRGVAAPAAVASLVVDMTLTLATQLVFTLAGVALLARHGPGGPLARTAWLSLGVAVPVVAVLLAVQRSGLFELLGRLARTVAGARFDRLVGGARRLDRAVRAVYRARARVLRCAAWQLAGWAAGAGEIWIFLAFAGARASVWDALAIEAIVQALSSAAFVVPGALGVQEGGFLAVGGAVGLSPDLALALALARRARDVLLFVPALLVWQGQEGRRLLAAREG
jgi:putative membrane protein